MVALRTPGTEEQQTPVNEKWWREQAAQVKAQKGSPEMVTLLEKQAGTAKRREEVENKVRDLVGKKLGIGLKFRSQGEFARALAIVAHEQIAGIVLEEFTIIVPKPRVSLFAGLNPERLAVMAEHGRAAWNLLEAVFGDNLPKILEARKADRNRPPGP